MATVDTMDLSDGQTQRTRITMRVAAAMLLSVAVGSLLLAVPGLRGVGSQIAHMRLGWIGAAGALELLSCAGFVVIFRLYFDELPAGTARELAWVEEGSGALLPGGGVGALAIGGVLLRRSGMSTKAIIDRSSALFFLTSALNVAALIAGGVWLAAAGDGGSSWLVHAGLPILGGVLATVAVLAIPPIVAASPERAWPTWLIDLAAGIARALGSVRRPSWRLLGAFGYLAFDIAALGATFAAAGRPIAVAPLVLGYLIGYLANLIPIPGGFGVLEGGLAGCLIAYGAPPTQAAAAVVVYHAIAFWVPSLGGLAGFGMLRRRLQTRSAMNSAARTGLRGMATRHPEIAEEPRMTTQDRRRWLALYVLCAGVLMGVIDATIVNVALPSIKHDLGFSQSGLAWVLNAYLISFGGLLLLAGRIGDLVGQRRVFLAGLGVFTTASALCGLAPDQGVLVVARFIQGVGGALTSAVILGMIVTMFPEPREQAKAIGVYGFVAAGGGSIGLLAGGVLTQAISWHWIFFINVPIGVVTAVLAVRLIEDRPGIGFGQGADIPGAILLTVALMLGVYTILQVSSSGWGSIRTLALGGVAVALLAAFIARQDRIANPLMPLRLFRSRQVSGANAIQALLVVGMFGMFFLGALYLQQILGYDALEVGLAFLPGTIAMGAMSLRFSGPLAMRFGAVATLVPGLVAIGAALLLFARTPGHASYVVDILPAMALLGLGAGLAFPALTMLAMSGATPSDSGLASGLVNTSLNVGGALGLAVLATAATERTHGLLAGGASAVSALNSGYHLAYLIAAALVAVAVVVALTVLRPRVARGRQARLATQSPAACGESAY